MCGIYGATKKYTSEELRQKVERFSFRGPDYSGMKSYVGEKYHLVLAHNRLAIIDLNARANQPMDKTECQLRLGWQTANTISHILFPAASSRPEKDYALAEAAIKFANHKLQTTNTPVVLHAFYNTPNTETPYWYNAADVVLMTSKWEGSPNAIKEAMACSRPIVAVNVGDIAERTSGVEGCYVAQSREPQELASLIEKALTFTQTNGRERIIADGLDGHDVNQKLINVYLFQ